MPPVTEQITETDSEPTVDDVTHLDAAREFFAAADKPPVVKAAAAPVAAAVPDILTQVVKGKAADAPVAGAPDAPEADDISKGLQAPPENAKSHSGWQELKKKGNEALQRAAAAERKLGELEAKSKSAPPVAADEATTARLAQLENQNKAFSDRLKVLDLRNHPEFVEKFSVPQAKAKAALAQVTKDDEVDVDIDGLLSLKGKAFNAQVSETLESLTPYARVKFQTALEAYISANIGAEGALSSADEFLKTAKQSTGARSREAFDRVGGSYRDQFIPLTSDEKSSPEDRASADEYNAALASIPKVAEKYAFGELNESTAADMAHKAALFEFTMTRALPQIGKLFNSAVLERDAKITTLETQVRSLTAAKPTVSGGAGSSGAEAPPADETHLAAARRFFS